MSITKNETLRVRNVVTEYLWCRTYSRSGVKLSEDQNKVYQEALALFALCWYDLISLDRIALPRWFKPWLKVISETDVSHLVAVLKASDAFLIQMRSVPITKHTFKQYVKQYTSVVQAGKIIAPALDLVEAWFVDELAEVQVSGDTTMFRKAHMCFAFITRLNLPGLEDLQMEAYANYLLGEEALIQENFTLEEGAILSSWFPSSHLVTLLDGWRPKHGPGAVADAKKSLTSKYESFRSDDMIQRLDLLLGGNTTPRKLDKGLERVSKVVFVPKSIDKLRTICEEPAILQWYQQGFAESVSNYVKNHKYLRRRIDLEDQGRSVEMAYEGSIDGYYSTIDLSSASDSISWTMLKEWTRRSCLLPIIWMTRSKKTELPDGEVITLKKYASMGSTLCFPIECIVFCAIVEASIREYGDNPLYSKYRVYGDDIIIETKYALLLIERLEQNGFKVNTSKSFYTLESHNFRESCGGEFLDGDDVKPVRLSRKFSGFNNLSQNLDPNKIAACIDLCNASYMHLPSVRRVVIWELLKLPQHLRPLFDSSGETGIFSVTPTNYHLAKPLYRARYQNLWTKHGGVLNRLNTDHGEEDLALYETLRAIHTRKQLLIPEDLFVVAMGRQDVPKWGVITSPDTNVVSQTTVLLKKEKVVE